MTVVVNEASCVQLTCVTLNSIRINPIDWCQFYRYWRTCPCLSARTRIIHNSFTKWRLNSATQLMRWWTACDCRRHSQSQLMSWRQLFSIRRAQKLTVNHNCRMSHEFDACGVRRKGRGANWRSENAFIDAQTTSRTEISLHWTSQMSRAEAIANGVHAKIKAAIWCRPFFGGILPFVARLTNTNSTLAQPPWTQINIYSVIRSSVAHLVACFRVYLLWKYLHDLTLPLSANMNAIIFNLYPLLSAASWLGKKAAANRHRILSIARQGESIQWKCLKILSFVIK